MSRTVITTSLFITLFLSYNSYAQFQGEWYLMFIDGLQTDTVHQCKIRIEKKGQVYTLTHVKSTCTYLLPPEGTYRTGMDNSLINGSDSFSRVGTSLQYPINGKVAEFHSERLQNVVAGYVRYTSLFLEMADSMGDRRTEYISKGIEAAKKGISIDEYCMECYFNLSVAMYKLDKIDSAAFYLEIANGINPDSPFIRKMYEAIGDYYLKDAWKRYGKIGKYPQAIKLLKKALSYDTTSADIWYNIGGASYMNKQYPEAIAAFKRCLELDPDHEEAKHGLDAAEEDNKAKIKAKKKVAVKK